MMKVLQKIRNAIKFKGKYNDCTIAKNVEIIDSELKKSVNVAHDASIIHCEIEKYTSIGRYSKLQDCRIGKFCSISWDVTIGAKSHPLDSISTHSFPYNKLYDFADNAVGLRPLITTIGNDVWIGCGAIIKSGIKIGDGAVIGAGAVVTKDVEPYSIVVGSPAKKIKNRFSEAMIEKLESIKWWDLDEHFIKEHILMFQQPLTLEMIESLLKEKETL